MSEAVVAAAPPINPSNYCKYAPITYCKVIDRRSLQIVVLLSNADTCLANTRPAGDKSHRPPKSHLAGPSPERSSPSSAHTLLYQALTLITISSLDARQGTSRDLPGVEFLSHIVFLKSFRRSQLLPKSVNLSLTITNIKNK